MPLLFLLPLFQRPSLEDRLMRLEAALRQEQANMLQCSQEGVHALGVRIEMTEEN